MWYSLDYKIYYSQIFLNDLIFLRSIRVKYVKPTVHSDNSLFVYQPLSNKTAQIGPWSIASVRDQNKTNRCRQVQLRVFFANSAYFFTGYLFLCTVIFLSPFLQIQIRMPIKKIIFKLFMYTANSIYYFFSYVLILTTVNRSIFLTYIFQFITEGPSFKETYKNQEK